MRRHTIALFGEAERGEFSAAYFCQDLWQLATYLGEPPHSGSQGLEFAIQALLFERGIIYFRVREEGFSFEDYLKGLNFLAHKEKFPPLSAICLPGVGNKEIIEATTPLCQTYQSFLILTDKDLYDFLVQ